MGKYKTETFTKESEAGEKLHLKIDFFINANAEFYFKAQEALYANCKLLAKDKKYGCHEGKNNNFYSSEYGKLKRLIGDSIDLILKTQKKEELIIVYSFKFNGSYYKTADGDIFPNGYIAPQGRKGKHKASWNSDNSFGSSFDESEGYEIQVYAKVVNKITYSNGTLEKVVFESPDSFDHIGSEDSSWGEKLNYFNKMPIGRPSQNRSYIPYTEKSAKFFYDLIISICKMNEKLSSLNDPKILNLIMEKNIPLLSMVN